jgi:hypothetical protein
LSALLRRSALLFAVALAVRLAAVVLLGRPEDVWPETIWTWAYEQGRIAEALLRGDGYADVMGPGSGPTAWCGPVYPVFLAAAIRVAGGVSRGAALIVVLVHVALAAGIAVHLMRLGQALGRPRLGILAGWTWALHPGAIYYPIDLVWDSVFVAFGLTWFLAALARARVDGNARAIARCGAGFGALALVNPAPLVILPALWLFLGRARTALLFTAATALVLVPWSLRNVLVLGTPSLKANLGVELRVGNTDGADGGFRPHAHPSFNLEERARYVELGELAYSRESAARFRAWVAANPGRFATLTVVRARNFWLGLNPFADVPLRSGETRARDWQGWIEWCVYFFFGASALVGVSRYRDERGGAVLLRAVVLLFPIVYYVTHVFERYRFPIEPVLTYLAAALALSAWTRFRA